MTLRNQATWKTCPTDTSGPFYYHCYHYDYYYYYYSCYHYFYYHVPLLSLLSCSVTVLTIMFQFCPYYHEQFCPDYHVPILSLLSCSVTVLSIMFQFCPYYHVPILSLLSWTILSWLPCSNSVRTWTSRSCSPGHIWKRICVNPWSEYPLPKRPERLCVHPSSRSLLRARWCSSHVPSAVMAVVNGCSKKAVVNGCSKWL